MKQKQNSRFNQEYTTFSYKRGEEALAKFIKRCIPHPERLTLNQMEELKEKFIK